MELGATVCTGNVAPICTACPVRRCCLAHQRCAASGGAAPPVTAYPAKVRWCPALRLQVEKADHLLRAQGR